MLTSGWRARITRSTSAPSRPGLVRSGKTAAIRCGLARNGWTASCPSAAGTVWKPVCRSRASAVTGSTGSSARLKRFRRCGAGRARRRAGGDGEIEAKGRTERGGAFDGGGAAMGVHDAEDGGEAQAAAGKLGGEERIEGPGERAGVRPWPVAASSRQAQSPAGGSKEWSTAPRGLGGRRGRVVRRISPVASPRALAALLTRLSTSWRRCGASLQRPGGPAPGSRRAGPFS